MGRFHRLELPAEDLVIKGLEDIANGVESIESLLVAAGAPRLRRSGIVIPEHHNVEFPELRLYRLIQAQDPDDAHGRMNAYIRRLVSFESALEAIHRT